MGGLRPGLPSVLDHFFIRSSSKIYQDFIFTVISFYYLFHTRLFPILEEGNNALAEERNLW